MNFYLSILQLCIVSEIYGQNTLPHLNNPVVKIGYIAPDSSIDDPTFHVCDESNIHEYYQVNPLFGEGLISIQQYFNSVNKELNAYAQNDGLIVLRFVINCDGAVGRLRSKFFTTDYQEKKANIALQRKLIGLVKHMGRWEAGNYQGKKYDSYQHIKFRIKDHEVIDIFF